MGLLDLTVYYLPNYSVALEGIKESDAMNFKAWIDGMERGSFDITSDLTGERKWFRKEGLAFIDVKPSRHSKK